MDVVERYRLRREARLEKKNGKRLDSVDAFKQRRTERMQTRMDIEWEENEHPRDENGQFTSGSGGSSGGNKNKPKTEKKSESNKVVNGKIPLGENEHDGSKYKGKPGEVKSGKNGDLKPKSDGAKRIDTADAIAEVQKYKETGGKKGIAENSLTKYVDKDGKLSPERQAVHDEIIQSFFASKVPQKGQATMIMSGGGPASGKSFVEKGARAKFGDDTTITIDPDKFKAMLPGYADMAKKDEGAAGYFHEESSALAKRAYQYAAENNLNVVYDGTGDGSIGSVMKKLKTAQDAGYAVKGQYVTVDVDEALKRNQKRFEDMKERYEKGESDIPPRKPKEDHVRDIHAKVSDIGLDVAGLFDDWELTDNNVKKGEERPVIARCKKGGEIEVVKGMEDKVQKWLDKGTSGAKVVNGKIVRKKPD